VAASAAIIVVKSDVSMHSANTGPARPDVTAGATTPAIRRGGRPGQDEPADESNKTLDQIDRLIDTAAQMLADEKDLN
jgi:hypothetical protein